jgi:alpha-ketoglutarate-dependent taurine dioxygenase
MDYSFLKHPGPKKGIERKTLSLSGEDLIKMGSLQQGAHLPLVVQPAFDGVDLVQWASGNREAIETLLLDQGAILFRNFDMTVDKFQQLASALGRELLEYHERSSPRSHVSGKIYTSTDYPAYLSIFLHNENSYAQVWPMKIFFYCETPAQQGGETPIADVRRVYQRIDPQVRDRFVEKGWLLIRNFGDGVGLDWKEVFQTTDKSVIEEHCRRNAIECEWKDGDRLRTRQVRQAVARHPRTGEMVWFNHAAFFHISTLDAGVRELLLEEFAEEDLPNNTYYGDGSCIEPFALNEIREAYLQESVSFPWQMGDVLLLDNMLTAHGRAPFKGPRKTLVGMAEPHSNRHI